MIARMFSTHSRSSRSSPIWVSFTETFESAPVWRMRSNVSRYVSRAAPASAALVTDSPSRSRLAGMHPAVRSAERAAAERRNPEAEHGGDVAVARAGDDALSHGARRLVEHR